MATPALPFNPYSTTNVVGSFQAQSGGFIQGIARPDPAVQNELAAGILASTETIPMWGGVGIQEFIPSSTAQTGGNIVRAASNTVITGFSVSNQNTAALKTPQSEVGVTLSGGQVNFYRFGSGARIAVACDPTLAAALLAGTVAVNGQVSWDFTNQKLITYDGGVGALNCEVLQVNSGNSMIAVYTALTNTCNWNYSGSVAIIKI